MSDFSNALRRLREARGWTQDELAKAAGLSRTQIIKYEQGNVKPHPKNLKSLATAFGVYIETLLAYDKPGPAATPRESTSIVADPRADPGEGGILVPLLGRIAATPFRLAQPNEATKWVKGFRSDLNAYALEIKGDSMEPEYKDGEIIFVRKDHVALTPYAQDADDGIPYVPYEHIARYNGKDCIIGINGESTFKRLEITRGKGPAYTIEIKPLNPKHETIKVRVGDEFYVDGVCYRSEKDR